MSDKTTVASLDSALAAVGCPEPTPPPSTSRGYAVLLARQLLRTSPDSVGNCFRTFKEALSRLIPEPPRDRARELFKYVRPLWVEPADVAYLPPGTAMRIRWPSTDDWSLGPTRPEDPVLYPGAVHRAGLAGSESDLFLPFP